MPPKRKIANISTGGTEDVRPQILSVADHQSVVGEQEIAGFSTPVPRGAFQKDLAQVMEILSVSFFYHTGSTASVGLNYCILSTSIPNGALQGAPVTSANIEQQMADTRIVAAFMELLETPVGTANNVNYPQIYDLRDGVGHGVIIATDTMFLTFGGTPTAAALGVTAKILYRMINVGIMEYVGIVQSQQ